MQLNVLIVDDSWAMRRFVLKQVRACGPIVGECFEAGNGEEALARLREEKVDIVLSDINMPGMDGIELAKAIRLAEETSHIAVVIISSDPAASRERECRSLGAIGYVEKPFSPHKLLKEMERLFGLAEVLVETRTRT